MLLRIFACSVLLSPLVLVAAAPAAGAAAFSPPGVTARTVAAAQAQPVLRLGSRGGAVVTLQQRLAALHYFDVVAEPESFLVTKQDQLEPHEQDRARDWAAKLAARIARAGQEAAR